MTTPSETLPCRQFRRNSTFGGTGCLNRMLRSHWALENKSFAALCSTGRSKTQCFPALCLTGHSSCTVLNWALDNTMFCCTLLDWVLDNIRSDSLRLTAPRINLRNHCTSSNLLCAASQALSCALCGPSTYIYIYIYVYMQLRGAQTTTRRSYWISLPAYSNVRGHNNPSIHEHGNRTLNN